VVSLWEDKACCRARVAELLIERQCKCIASWTCHEVVGSRRQVPAAGGLNIDARDCI
jgi:hypothetical protein